MINFNFNFNAPEIGGAQPAAPAQKSDPGGDIAPAAAPPAAAAAAEAAKGGIEAAGQLNDAWTGLAGSPEAATSEPVEPPVAPASNAEVAAPASNVEVAAPAPGAAAAENVAPLGGVAPGTTDAFGRQQPSEAGFEAAARNAGVPEDEVAASAEYRAYLRSLPPGRKPDGNAAVAIYARHNLNFDPHTFSVTS